MKLIRALARVEGRKGHTRIAPGVCAGYGWVATCSCGGEAVSQGTVNTDG